MYNRAIGEQRESFTRRMPCNSEIFKFHPCEAENHAHLSHHEGTIPKNIQYIL